MTRTAYDMENYGKYRLKMTSVQCYLWPGIEPSTLPPAHRADALTRSVAISKG